LGSVEEGLGRALDRHRRMKTEGGEDRFEKEALDFHRRVREGYLELARLNPGRISVLDGLGSVEDVHRRVLERLDTFLAGWEAR
jgi:dTMP kinase